MNIKTTITAALVAIIATTAHAQERTTLDICTEWGEFSAGVMELRQGGMALSTLLREFAALNGAQANETQMAMMLQAYDMPRFNYPDIVDEVIQDFRNDQEHACFMAFSQGA